MIAYLVLVHRYSAQFKRMFKSIYDPKNHYLIHIDKNSGPELENNIRHFLSYFSNSAVLEGRRALWGGYSLVDAELRGIAQLLEMGANWEFFINLSGQDYPLKSQEEIATFLKRNRGKEFIKVLDQRKARPETMQRVGRYVVEFEKRIVRTPFPHSFMSGVSPYIGNQWMIVSRRFCEFVSHDPQAKRYKAFYRNTFIPDEGFFQTVMMNTAGHGEIVNDDLRMIDWVPDGDIKLRPRTFTAEDATELLASPCLFARKFDSTVDDEILDMIDDRLRTDDALLHVPTRPLAPIPVHHSVPVTQAAFVAS
ncbi:glycosyl transferase [Bosea sp. Root381]|uniref:beta-1,6-N-acetylglucosaminyltransferase n=1 Tax=Bosea sp. Root381 TaxID=1736524 RepID=UPI0006F42CAE|nr:beta-1,6-N-acetylglucosaminyltransferase [Bosea sp. Root381]KRE04308.1 glycosyl transferase [Bosea sp. Root381]